jgi:hypothetical protein
MIYLSAPGPMSKVVSPIRARIYMSGLVTGITKIELYGEDERLIARQTTRTTSETTGYFYLPINVPFEIRSAAEVGRLQITTENRAGVILGFLSTNVLMLSVGAEEINPVANIVDVCSITTPKYNALISGGSLFVEGEMSPLNDQPVIFEIVDEKGAPLGLRVWQFEAGNRSAQSFSFEIPYKKLETLTGAFLVVRQSSDTYQGLVYLYTRKIVIKP